MYSTLGASNTATYTQQGAWGQGTFTANIIVYDGAYTPQTVTNTLTYSTSCFTKGTPILTLNGSEPIQNVSIGTNILSFDSATGQITQSEVTGVFVRYTPLITVIQTRLGTVNTTKDHPFYVGNGAFAKVADLTVGEEVGMYESGRLIMVPIESISIRSAPQEVYNLEVNGTHTYFASDFAVHNKAGGP